MKNPILMAGWAAGPSNTAVNYWPGFSSPSSIAAQAWGTVQSSGETFAPVDGTISNLVIRVPTALTQGSYTYALLVNGTARLSVVVDTTTTGLVAIDTTSFAVVAGDKLTLRCTPTGTPTAQGEVQASFIFDGAGTSTALFGSAVGATGVGTAVYSVPGPFSTGTITTNTLRLGIMPCAGTMSSLYVNLSSAPGGTTTRTVTVVKNGLDTALTVIITGAATSANITGQAVSWAAGDTITIRADTQSAISTRVNISIGWTPTNAGDVPVFNMFSNSLSGTATGYNAFGGTAGQPEATETNTLVIAPTAFNITFLRQDFAVSPGTAKSRALTVRQGQSPGGMADTAASVTITGAAITGSWSGSLPVAANDLLSLSTVPTGTPTAPNPAKSSATINVPSGTGVTADNLTTSSPALDTPSIAQVHGLAAAGLAVGSPALGSPALAQVQSLSASSMATGSPVLPTPALSSGGAGGARVILSWIALESYALSRTVSGLQPNGTATSSPVIGSPGLQQVHSLNSSPLATSAPALGSPSLHVTYFFSPNSFATSAPAIGSPAVGQSHGLQATGVVTASPVLGVPALNQGAGLSTGGLTTASPVLGTPGIAQRHALQATQLTTASPALGSPLLAQRHVLGANGITTSPPVLGSPALHQSNALTAVGVVTQPPEIGTPDLHRIINLVADPLITGAPVSGSPVIHVADLLLIANNLATGSPVLGRPQLRTFVMARANTDRTVTSDSLADRIIVADPRTPRVVEADGGARTVYGD